MATKASMAARTRPDARFMKSPPVSRSAFVTRIIQDFQSVMTSDRKCYGSNVSSSVLVSFAAGAASSELTDLTIDGNRMAGTAIAIESFEVAIVAALIGGVASYYWAAEKDDELGSCSVLGAILTFGIMRKFVPALVDTGLGGARRG